MKTRNVSIWIVAAAVLLPMAVNAGEVAAEAPKAGVAAAAKPALTTQVYTCPHCHTMALEAGSCACGAKLEAKHLLGTKGGEGLVCGCAGTCKCDAAGIKEGKCACGKEVGKVGAKGMYVCPDGCPEVSVKAGKCACGKDLTQVK